MWTNTMSRNIEKKFFEISSGFRRW